VDRIGAATLGVRKASAATRQNRSVSASLSLRLCGGFVPPGDRALRGRSPLPMEVPPGYVIDFIAKNT
jgi:hypothetical protein